MYRCNVFRPSPVTEPELTAEHGSRDASVVSVTGERTPTDRKVGGMGSKTPAVVLLSGGLDSTTVLAIAKDADFAPYALSFHYGQRHSIELQAATHVAAALGVRQHVIADIDLRLFGGSALTSDAEVPKARALAEVLAASDIFIGVNARDYSGYPDCRPEYIAAYTTMANLATKAGVEGRQRLHIHTPLINLTKAEIIRHGLQLGIDYGLTSSCYDPSPEGHACGSCDSCLLRLKGFAEAGATDPIKYRA